MRKAMLIAAVVLSLPALLFIYQPSVQFGGVGLYLGITGMTLSPLILYSALAYFVIREWNA